MKPSGFIGEGSRHGWFPDFGCDEPSGLSRDPCPSFLPIAGRVNRASGMVRVQPRDLPSRIVMERDASTAVEVVPPIAWETTRKIALIGLGLTGTAAALGLLAAAIDPPAILHTVRLFFVFFGAVIAGLAISFRSDLWQPWALGACTALLAVFGTPAHWDSFQILFGVLTGLALLRAGLVVAPQRIRLGIVSAFLLLHFFGILLATTSPNPTPWMVDQLYRRVYEPYLQFVYLRNAYHFYSPEPGPASILVCLLKTEDGEDVGADGIRRKKYRTEWVATPRRPADIRDPLGVTYFRRLSLTDQISHGYPDMTNVETLEKSEIRARRYQLTQGGNKPYIRMHPFEPDNLEYRLPEPIVSRYLLPSYAQHLLMDLPEGDRKKTTVKLYRVEHRTLTVGAYIGLVNPGKRPGDPYHPTTYWPYFMGEFGFAPVPNKPGEWRVELLDPQEPMLYWLVPIIGDPGSSTTDPNRKDYIDYLSVHAGREFDWSLLR